MLMLLSALAVALFVGAAMTDLQSRRIPNWLVLALAAVGLGRLVLELSGRAAWSWALLGQAAGDAAAAAAVLAAGAVLFQKNWLGGGDVKLLASGALWLGAGLVWPFLSATALAGGALGLLYLGLAIADPKRPVPRTLPYGVAIAAGGIATMGLAF